MFPSKTRDLPAALLVALLVAAHVALALGYAAVVPPLNWPDEPAHVHYAAALGRGEGPGTMSPEVWGGEVLPSLIDEHFASVEDPLGDERLRTIAYQAHQPPLYYFVAAQILERFPGLLPLRALNVLLSSLSLLGVFVFVRRSLGDVRIATVAVGFLALLPTRTFMAVSIGNDPAIELVFVLFFVVLAGPRREPSTGSGSRARNWSSLAPSLVLGCLFGIGLLTKATAILLPAVQTLWLRHKKEVVLVLATSIVGALIASPWLLRNVALYGAGDPLALGAGALGAADRPVLELTGPHGIPAFVRLLFISFWGVFGWMEMFPGPGLWLLYLALSVAALLGLARRRSGVGGLALPKGTLARCFAAVGLGASAVLVYAMFDFQPQGRYLLPFSAPLALLFAVGWMEASRRGAVIAVAALFGLGSANLYSLLYVVPWYLER